MIFPGSKTPTVTKSSFASEFARATRGVAAKAKLRFVNGGERRIRAKSDETSLSAAQAVQRLRSQDAQALNETVQLASQAATAVLVQEAQDLPDPLRRPRVKTSRIKESAIDVVLYEYEKFAGSDDEGEAAVDEDVVVEKPTSASRSTTLPPRLAGYTTIQTSVDHFAATFAQERIFNTQHLHQDMATVELLYMVVEEKNKWIAIQKLQLQPRIVDRGTRRRDFIVVECQKRFVLPDGRQGWVQSLQTVDIPGQRVEGVRGSIQRSGVVAIESLVHKNTLDVVVTAQIDLRGSASSGAQRAVSRRRVLKVISTLAAPLEQHQVELMSFPGTHRFLEIEFELKNKRCKVCLDKVGRCFIPGWKPSRHSCRKCGVTVCRHCSHVWDIERQRTTAIVGGGRVITPTRVCNDCFSQPAASVSSASDYPDRQPRQSNCPLVKLREPRHGDHCRPHGLGDSRFIRDPTTTNDRTGDTMRPTQLEFYFQSQRRERATIAHYDGDGAESMKTISLE